MIKLGNLKSASEICLCGFVELTCSGKKKYIYTYTTVNIPIFKTNTWNACWIVPPHFSDDIFFRSYINSWDSIWSSSVELWAFFTAHSEPRAHTQEVYDVIKDSFELPVGMKTEDWRLQHTREKFTLFGCFFIKHEVYHLPQDSNVSTREQNFLVTMEYSPEVT